MDPNAQFNFPPRLDVGNRVWSGDGFHDHGHLKVNIPPDTGGMITDISKPYSSVDQYLYSVRWDDGSTSVHYSKDLVCIGRFKSFQEFQSAIELHGPIHLTVGPRGGFREAEFSATYDKRRGDVHLAEWDRELWRNCLRPLAMDQKIKIVETRLSAGKRSPD